MIGQRLDLQMQEGNSSKCKYMHKITYDLVQQVNI